MPLKYLLGPVGDIYCISNTFRMLVGRVFRFGHTTNHNICSFSVILERDNWSANAKKSIMVGWRLPQTPWEMVLACFVIVIVWKVVGFIRHYRKWREVTKNVVSIGEVHPMWGSLHLVGYIVKFCTYFN